MDTMYKTFRAEVKGIDAETGTVDLHIPMSTESVDRDGEVIALAAWKKTLTKFKKHPVLLSSHNYGDLRKQIGELTGLKLTETGMLARPKYYVHEGNEEADWAFNLARKGMAAFSVGFIPLAWEDGDGEKAPRRTYTDVELLEISQVCVPSNRDAIQGVRSKSVDPVVLEICDEVESLVTKPEETDEYFRVPVPKEAGKHEGHRIRTIVISSEKGIKALYCGECKVNITYLFDKEKWDSMEECQEWVKEHSKAPKEITQEAIRDEIDYLCQMIAEVGLNDDNKALMWDTLRDSGGDMPVDVIEHAKAVIASKNVERLTQIKNLVDEILGSGEPEPEPVPVVRDTEGERRELLRAFTAALTERLDRAVGKT